MSTPSLKNLAELARRAPALKGYRKVRTVVRFDKSEVQRLDALRGKLGWPSRAALVRVFVLWGLSVVETLPPGALEGEGGAR
jgi:hypothetical protein